MVIFSRSDFKDFGPEFNEKVNFSSSNSCLIQHVAKNIMGVKQKWIEIGRPGRTFKDN